MNKKITIEKTNEGIITCRNCGVKNNYRHITTDMIDLLEVEKDRVCNNCDELMDSWAYGYWESSSNLT